MSIQLASHLLAELGFKKRSGDVYTIDVAPGVLGWLGFNRATRHSAPGEVEINPVVGVRFQEVERLVAECRAEKFHGYQPPTISTPLGYLMPEKKYKAWMFTTSCSDAPATEMVGAIACHGVPFMRSVVDIAELRRQLECQSGVETQLAYRRPAAALVAGDAGRARALLESAMAAMARRTDLAAADFRKFARALLQGLPP